MADTTRSVQMKRKRGTRNTVSAIDARIKQVPKYSMFGASAMGFPEKISTTRGNMMVKHTSQRVVLRDPEFPYMFSGAENEFGKRSSWNVCAKHDYRLMKKFVKFKDVPNSPVCYILYDMTTGKYLCQLYEPCVNLVEKYGFRMYNRIVNYNEGDVIPADHVIEQSSSYVNDNYCAGINARMAYAVLPELTEDAIVVSSSFAKRAEYDMVDIVTVKISKNAYLLNKYGDQNLYKPFPDIGERVKNHILCSIRENSFVSSISEASVPHINDTNYFTDGIVSDIDIFTNVDVDNDQFNYYLTQIRDWYSAIYAYISTIMEDKTQDNVTLVDMYHKSQKFLNDSTWVSKEYIEDTVIRFKILKPVSINVGQKIVGRYGNKSVIAKIVDDDIMPHTDDGRPIDMLANALAVPNRIIAFATYESEVTFQRERMTDHLRKLYDEGESKDRIVELAAEFISIYNPDEGSDMMALYRKHPDDTFEDLMANGIYIRIEPFNKVCVRDAIIEGYNRFPDIMKKYKIKTKLRHRWVTIDGEYAVGFQYTWVLKQEPSKAMSVVATGRTTVYDLPVKTRMYAKNLRHYSDNPIKFGEYDTYNFLAGVGIKAYAKLSTYFRGSQYMDNSVLMGQLNNMEIDTSKYNSFPQLDNLRNVLKLMGIEMKPDIFGYNTIGAVDKEYEVFINNVKIKISIPDLRYILIMHSYYMQYDAYQNGLVDICKFIENIKTKTKIFECKQDDYIDSVIEKFIALLPVLQQMKQYV